MDELEARIDRLNVLCSQLERHANDVKMARFVTPGTFVSTMILVIGFSVAAGVAVAQNLQEVRNAAENARQLATDSDTRAMHIESRLFDSQWALSRIGAKMGVDVPEPDRVQVVNR